jgi:hypothetical protein
MARLDPWDARAILTAAGCDLETDFHALNSSKVDALRVQADARRYRRPKNANGSRLRYFHAYCVRRARLTIDGRGAA